MIARLSLFPISSGEDRYGFPRFPVFARVLPHPLSSAALATLLVPSSAFPFSSSEKTNAGPPSPQAPLPGRLPCLSSGLHSLVGSRTAACASLARGEKPTGSAQADTD